MLDHVVAREAFRTRLLTLVVATTGTTTLAATTTGFTRLAGSFITDGFAAGMEIVPAGFTSNTPAIIQSVVDATHITIEGTRAAQVSDSGRSLTVGLPLDRRWQGTQTPATTAPATRPMIVEQWVPGLSADDGGIVDTGFYVITWNGLSNRGVKAMFAEMQAVRNLFPPGYTFSVQGTLIRVTGNPAPSFTTPVTLDNGYESSTLSIPWRIMTTSNLNAA